MEFSLPRLFSARSFPHVPSPYGHTPLLLVQAATGQSGQDWDRLARITLFGIICQNSDQKHWTANLHIWCHRRKISLFPMPLLVAVPTPELALLSAGSFAELILLTNPAESYSLSGGFWLSIFEGFPPSMMDQLIQLIWIEIQLMDSIDGFN